MRVCVYASRNFIADIQVCRKRVSIHAERTFFFLIKSCLSNIHSRCHNFFPYSECMTKVTLSSNVAFTNDMIFVLL